MSEIQSFNQSEKYETFSYLPQMTADQVRKQVEYMISKGWNPAIEHSEPENAFGSFWYMWKLPMFGEQSVDTVLAEVEACKNEHPDHLVRVIGYDNFAQCQGTSFVVHRGE
ncbi:ribulose bisphosphate carboxylase small subunit [Ectothiorhodospira lacustris]|uniref:ribulose bisphosphate carboxylase small subunit n=1 Tax=Ectothiorhodospira lacustris TaxID=2899127 RepID=UPI001EE7FD30|nr:ribulose bisphosphate carboxylase small subunit [Ectothiorhodospira lacustris]MCG5501934.1 ribulose bisphosphate carboxylase small subunit [Ectothiorhodospira lacustris]MCG5510677.1 ribulose bisphosphate carboxylase small subunit [Ectothiorhodospira lacustris]MCG5522423.1 ribulose bisphosphate carboxylase small subunit [Ectothiorhodospira lacustris]